MTIYTMTRIEDLVKEGLRVTTLQQKNEAFRAILAAIDHETRPCANQGYQESQYQAWLDSKGSNSN